MPPIQSSQDVLMYVMSAVIIIVGILLSFTLYYLFMSLRDTRKVTKDVRTRVEAFWEVVELARDKLQVGGAVFKVAATGIKELAEHMRSFADSDEKPKKKKKKKKDDEEE